MGRVTILVSWIDCLGVKIGFPLFKVRGKLKCYRAKTTIEVRMYREGAWFFAENETLDVIGTGETIQEAFLDVQQHIAYFKEHYSGIAESRLSSKALRLKEAYSCLEEITE